MQEVREPGLVAGGGVREADAGRAAADARQVDGVQEQRAELEGVPLGGAQAPGAWARTRNTSLIGAEVNHLCPVSR